MTQPESAILRAVFKYLATRPDLRAWRNATGTAISMDGRNIIRFGIDGQADISGILADGRRLEIETKTQKGRLSKEQQNYRDMILRFNGVYIVARSADDVHAGLLMAERHTLRHAPQPAQQRSTTTTQQALEAEREDKS